MKNVDNDNPVHHREKEAMWHFFLYGGIVLL